MEANDFFKLWFKGFEKGLERMTPAEREPILQECAEECSRSYPLGIYREAYARSTGIEDFLRNLKDGFSELSYSISGDRKTVTIAYDRCACELYTCGLVKSDLICECSRLSLKYIWESVLGEGCADVELKQSILQGKRKCIFKVMLK